MAIQADHRSVKLGLLILIASIVVFLFFYRFYGVEKYLFVPSAISSMGGKFCNSLGVYGQCSSYYIYLQALSLPTRNLVVLPQVLLVVIVYVVVYLLTRSHIVSGLTSLLYVVTPGVLAIYTIDQSGLLIVYSLSSIPLLLILLGLYKSKTLLITGVVAYALMFYSPLLSVILLVVSLVILIDMEKHRDSRHAMYALLAMTLILLIAGFVNNATYYGVFYAPSLTAGIATSILLLVVSRSIPGGYASVLKTSGVIVVITVLLVSMYLGEFTVTRVGEYNLFSLYGVFSILAVTGIIYLLLREPVREALALVVASIILILLSSINTYMYPLALPVLAVTSSIVLNAIVNHIALLPMVKTRRLTAIGFLVLIILIPVVVQALVAPVIVETGVRDPELYELAKTRNINVSQVNLYMVFSNIASKIKSETSDALIVAHWDYSYILLGTLVEKGVYAKLVANGQSSYADKLLLSSIMTSHWETGIKLLKILSEMKNTRDVYVIVAFTYSVMGNSAYIGVPTTIETPSSQYPVLIFEAYGDLYHLVEYMNLANKSLNEYFIVIPGLLGGGNIRVIPLMWQANTDELFINQLVIKALNTTNHTRVYNYNWIGRTALTPKISGLRVVDLEDVKLGFASTLYGDYEIHYIVAVFKLET